MKTVALPLLILLGGLASPSQTPFDRYMAAVKHHQIETSELAFLRKCGVGPAKAMVVYGATAGDQWTPSSDLATAVYNTESDYFTTAEVWWNDGMARAVDFWSLDTTVDLQSNSMFCLRSSGKIQFATSTNVYLPIDGGPGGWTYRQSLRFDKSGKLIGKSGHFVNGHGETVPRPKLDEDDEKNFDWVPDTQVITELTSQLRPR